MSENIINISLEAKGSPTVNITTNEAGNITSVGSVSPVINFIATGNIGPTGANGNDGTAVVPDGSITSAKLAPNSVGASQIIAGSIGNSELSDNSVYGSKILENSISGDRLVNNSISANKIANNSINASKISNGSISRALLAADLISSNEIEDKSIFGGQIANNTIVKELIVDNSIDGAKIEDNVTLVGTVTVDRLELDGGDSALIEGPSGDDINIKTHDELNIQNTSGNTVASFDQSGNLTLSGNVDGINIATDVAANTLKTGITTSQSNAIISNTAKETNTVTNLGSVAATNSFTITSSDGQNASLNSASQSNWGVMTNDHVNAVILNTAKPDLTVDGSGTVHANNYTDTVYTHPSSHPISLITGLQTALNAKQDSIGNEDLTIQQTDGLQDALDGKVDDSQVLTNVPANAVFTDTNTTYSVQDGELSQNNFTDADHAKLNNIEANATTDQTKADIDALGIAATTAVSLTAGNKTIDGSLDIGSNTAGHDLNLYGANLNNASAGWVSSANLFKFTDSTKLGFGTANQPGAVDSSIQANGNNLIISNTVGNIQIGDTVEITGDLTISGTVDGIDIATDVAANTAKTSFPGFGTSSGTALEGNTTIPTQYTDANAVSALAAADKYLKNDASDSIAGTLTMQDALFVQRADGTNTTKSKLRNNTTTSNRTLTVPDATGVFALTNSLIDAKTASYWSSSTGGFYITLSGASTSENTSLSTASYTLMYVVPFDGKIKRISSFHQSSTSGTSTFEVYIDGDDSDLVADQRGSDMTTSSHGAKFTEDCPADWTFSKGEAIAIKRTDSTPRYGVTMTIVFEYDTTT